MCALDVPASETAAAYLTRPWLRYYPEGVPPDVPVPEESIPQAFDEACARFGNRAAIVFYGRRMSYKELRQRTDSLAAALVRLGVHKGDRIALYLLNSPQFVISYFGALKAGAALTPISPVYTSIEVRHQLSDSGARFIICQDLLYDNVEKADVSLDHVVLTGIGDYLPALKRVLGKSVLRSVYRDMHVPSPKILSRAGYHKFQELIADSPAAPPPLDIDPGKDLAALPYTGGTTGLPKGALLTHRSLLACCTQNRRFWPIFEDGKEVILAFLPFYHVYGQVVVMLSGLLHGATLVVFTTPDVEAILDGVEAESATAFYGVPTLYEYLKDHEKTERVNWKRLKMITCGADTLHESTVKDWERRTGTRIMEGYGLTETSSTSHCNPPGRSVRGSFGLPLPNMGAAIVDAETADFLPVGEVGELIVKGPNVMTGYWNKPEDTREVFLESGGETWLRTGDLVQMDEEGYFHFFDRKKDLIKYKGYSVFARDVEEVLYRHPQVKAAGVIGVPDPKVGQYVKAVVVLQPEARGRVSEEEILKYCEQNLAHYKVPKLLEFRGELPKTDVGKVSHRELREELED